MYPAIDIHAHFGDPACFPQQGLAKEFLRLPLPEFRSACARSHIAAACASPMEAIFPKNAAELLEANRRMAELSAREPLLYQWVVLNPLFPESYAQAEQMLESPKCVGIKLHPDGHGYALEQYGRQLFDFCAGRKALVEIHTGDLCSDPELLVPYANQNPGLRIIAAHVGYGGDGAAQIRAIQRRRREICTRTFPAPGACKTVCWNGRCWHWSRKSSPWDAMRSMGTRHLSIDSIMTQCLRRRPCGRATGTMAISMW